MLQVPLKAFSEHKMCSDMLWSEIVKMAPFPRVCQIFVLLWLLQTKKVESNSKLMRKYDMVAALHIETGVIKTFISVSSYDNHSQSQGCRLPQHVRDTTFTLASSKVVLFKVRWARVQNMTRQHL